MNSLFTSLGLFCLCLSRTALAARPYIDEPDTGLTTFVKSFPADASGKLIPISDIVTIPDFEQAAQAFMSDSGFSYYRTGAAGEFGYRANLETFPLVKLRPRILNDVTKMKNALNTTILGYNFSAPFFISPAAKAGLANASAEVNLVKGAAQENILYIPSLFATLTIEQIAAAKAPGQVTFQQLYVRALGDIQSNIQRAEAAGSKAIVWSVDNAWDPTRSRSQRWSDATNTYDAAAHTWDLYEKIRNMTTLPIILKGIQTWEDAKLAVEHGVDAIYISNHGARQLDTSQSVMQICLEIYDNAPEVFQQIEVLADGGVRYGSDILKLLAMGVKAVGMGRPFMYSNVYGIPGVVKLIQLMKLEVISDAGNLGLANLSMITPNYLNLAGLRQIAYLPSGV